MQQTKRKTKDAGVRSRPDPSSLTDITQTVGSAKGERYAARIYDSLLHAILTGKLTAGARLPSEIELSRSFEVSRPVVREALDLLRAQNLVVSARGSGSYVAELPPPEATAAAAPQDDESERVGHILSGLEFRMIVEPETAHLAALRRGHADIDRMTKALEGYEAAVANGDVPHHFDYAFHEAIAIATGNPRLAASLKSLEYDVSHSVQRMREMARYRSLGNSETVMAEHREVLALIAAQDAEGARRTMRNHLERARLRMLHGRMDI